MKKIRIPRKLKKHCADILFNSWKNFPNVPKLERYMSYFTIECGMKIHNMSAEYLCRTFGRYTKDDVVWWNWVRWKELGIEPKMSADIQEYWDYFVKNGIINKITK